MFRVGALPLRLAGSVPFDEALCVYCTFNSVESEIIFT